VPSNDLLSAHAPLQHYPDLIKTEARKHGATAQVAGGVPAMCDGVTQGTPGMELSLFSRDAIAMATAISLSHDVFDAALLLGVCDKIVPGLLIGALHFGHLPTVFVPAGPMTSGLSNSESNGAVFEIFPNATTLMPDDSSADCLVKGYRNTGQACPVQSFVSYQLKLEFVTPLTTFPSPPYDPFIFNSNGTSKVKGVEIHLSGKQPTTRADTSKLMTGDDKSVLNTSNTYKSANGLPWALDIPALWDYPYEFLDVVNVYPNIVPWAKSGGATHKNWYELTTDKVSKTFRNSR
jgi:LruC domain-containing protein